MDKFHAKQKIYRIDGNRKTRYTGYRQCEGGIKMKRLLICLLTLACLLSAAAASAQAEQNVLTDQMIVVNCEEWVSLRESPDTSSTRLAKVPLDACVSGCKDSGDFIYCEYEGQQGYILAKYLKPVYSYSLQSFIQEFSGEDLADIKNNGFILDTAYSYGSDSETIEVVCRDGKGIELAAERDFFHTDRIGHDGFLPGGHSGSAPGHDLCVWRWVDGGRCMDR